MGYKCPGQDSRNIKVSTIVCPNCGYDVEIFSDEITVKCPQCKQKVSKEKIPSCADWCTAAKECIGKEKWEKLGYNLQKNS